MNKVIVTVQQGVVMDVTFEDCKEIIEVEIRDFDVTEETENQDEGGNYYASYTYSNEADQLGLDISPKLTGNE